MPNIFVAGKRHAIAAGFMVAAVLAFAIGDTITKELTKQIGVLPVLAVRASIGAVIVVALGMALGFRPTKAIFTNGLLWGKTAIFVLTILSFAISFKHNSFTAFYIVFFVCLPIFAHINDYYISGIKPKLKAVAVVFVMLLLAIAPFYKDYDTLFGLQSLLPIATAFVYTLYLALSNFINRVTKLDAIVQSIPTFTIGGSVLLILSFFDDHARTDLFKLTLDYVQGFSVIAAGACAVIGVICLTQATRFDDSSRLVPYEYFLMVYALFIDKYAFGAPLEPIKVFCSIGILFAAFVLSLVQE